MVQARNSRHPVVINRTGDEPSDRKGIILVGSVDFNWILMDQDETELEHRERVVNRKVAEVVEYECVG